MKINYFWLAFLGSTSSYSDLSYKIVRLIISKIITKWISAIDFAVFKVVHWTYSDNWTLSRMFTWIFSLELFRAPTAQKMKFSIKDFFSKCDQISRKQPIWSNLLKNCLMEIVSIATRLEFVYFFQSPNICQNSRGWFLKFPYFWTSRL